MKLESPVNTLGIGRQDVVRDTHSDGCCWGETQPMGIKSPVNIPGQRAVLGGPSDD